MNKVLIYEDTGAKNQFIANCETTKDQANDLITVFQAYQDLKEIETIDEFYALVTPMIQSDDFDAVLRTNVDMKMTRGPILSL